MGGARTLVTARRVVFVRQEDAPPERPGWLLVDGSRIEACGDLPGAGYRAAAEALAAEHQARLDDHGDRLLTPAFVNAHTHVALGFLRGAATAEEIGGNMVRELFFRIEGSLTPAEVRAFARMGAWESLLHGVGLVWDHYYHALALAEGIAEVGVAAVVAPTLQDEAGPGVDRLEEQLAATRSLCDPGWAHRGIWAAVGPHATDTVSAPLWQRASTLAGELGVPLHAHLAQSIEEYRQCRDRHGCSPAAWLAAEGGLEAAPRALWAHAILVSRDDLALLDPARDAFAFCPYSQLVFAFPADPRNFESAGFPWAVATDTSASNDSMSVQKEMRYLAGQRAAPATWSQDYERFLRHGDLETAEAVWELRRRRFAERRAAVTPGALLRRVWQEPGALHPGFVAGRLEAGALASFVVWDVDHPSLWPRAGLSELAMGETSQAIRAMYVAGRSLGEPGRFHDSLRDSSAYRESLEEAQRRWQEVGRRHGLR